LVIVFLLASEFDIRFPLPDLGRIGLALLDEADDEAAQLDQGLIAFLVVEEKVGFKSFERDEGYVGGCRAWVSKLSVGSGMVATCRQGGKLATKVRTGFALRYRRLSRGIRG